jgi:hypothetical protein
MLPQCDITVTLIAYHVNQKRTACIKMPAFIAFYAVKG